MIDSTHKLPVGRQAVLLDLSRSLVYYRPQDVCEADLVLLRRIDEIHLEHPFAGARMLRDMLRREGHEIGRKHVTALLKPSGSRLCIAARTPANRTSRTGSIRTCSGISPSTRRTRSGQWTSRTSRWPRALSTSAL